MEKNAVMSVTKVSFLVLFAVLLGGQCTTAAAPPAASSGPDCSTLCNLCLLGMFIPVPGVGTGCSVICAGACYLSGANSSLAVSIPKSDQHYFCNVGCASHFCSNFLAKTDPELEKRCVNSCSQTCKTKNTLPHK